ncbi:unnamed protein product, partial [Coccothraustes coccothraustes]
WGCLPLPLLLCLPLQQLLTQLGSTWQSPEHSGLAEKSPLAQEQGSPAGSSTALTAALAAPGRAGSSGAFAGLQPGCLAWFGAEPERGELLSVSETFPSPHLLSWSLCCRVPQSSGARGGLWQPLSPAEPAPGSCSASPSQADPGSSSASPWFQHYREFRVWGTSLSGLRASLCASRRAGNAGGDRLVFLLLLLSASGAAFRLHWSRQPSVILSAAKNSAGEPARDQKALPETES